MMDGHRRLLRIIGAFVLVLFAGVIGYMVIEGWSFVESLYMTVITLSTVGYKEVYTLSDAGRIFTVFLIIGGVGFMLYAVTTMVQYVVEFRIRSRLESRRMKNRITQLKGHTILCGYGRVGSQVARSLSAEGKRFVVIDTDSGKIAQADEDGYLYIQGNASRDEVLQEAGIGRARSLIAAVGNDADNIYITLSAKVLRPDIFVVARGSDEESESKLKRAGADRTILPLHLSGRRMAMLALRPLVVDLIETTMQSRDRSLLLEDVKITTDSLMAGATVKEIEHHRRVIAVLAVRKSDGRLQTRPHADMKIEPDDEVILMATDTESAKAEGPASPAS